MLFVLINFFPWWELQVIYFVEIKHWNLLCCGYRFHVEILLIGKFDDVVYNDFVCQKFFINYSIIAILWYGFPEYF